MEDYENFIREESRRDKPGKTKAGAGQMLLIPGLHPF